MVPLLVKSISLSVKISRSTIVQMPESTVMLPLLIKVPPSPKSLLGLAPSGTVQPEEIVTSAAEYSVIITLVNVTEPQVRVVLSVLSLAERVTIRPDGKVPVATFKLLDMDMVV